MTIVTLSDLHAVADLERACGVEAPLIETYANSDRQGDYYKAVRLAKRGKRRNGEYRIVFAAQVGWLSGFHRSVAMIVSNSTTFGEHVQGFVKRRSTRSNARQHLGQDVLLHADIKGFFDAITTEHIRIALITAGAIPSIANILAKACSIDGLLRQGTRCSPTIANLVSQEMDGAFLRLAAQNKCTYTRYADDLTFSGKSVPSGESVSEILKSHGFALRDDKCFSQHKGRNQFVTGLSVADSRFPRLPKRLKREMRLTMYYIGKYGFTEHFARQGISNEASAISSLGGLIQYAQSIEPALVSKWQNIFETAKAMQAPDGDTQEPDELGGFYSDD